MTVNCTYVLTFKNQNNHYTDFLRQLYSKCLMCFSKGISGYSKGNLLKREIPTSCNSHTRLKLQTRETYTACEFEAFTEVHQSLNVILGLEAITLPRVHRPRKIPFHNQTNTLL